MVQICRLYGSLSEFDLVLPKKCLDVLFLFLFVHHILTYKLIVKPIMYEKLAEIVSKQFHAQYGFHFRYKANLNKNESMELC